MSCRQPAAPFKHIVFLVSLASIATCLAWPMWGLPRAHVSSSTANPRWQGGRPRGELWLTSPLREPRRAGSRGSPHFLESHVALAHVAHLTTWATWPWLTWLTSPPREPGGAGSRGSPHLLESHMGLAHVAHLTSSGASWPWLTWLTSPLREPCGALAHMAHLMLVDAILGACLTLGNGTFLLTLSPPSP